MGEEPVEVRLEVSGELLAVGAGSQVAQGEAGGVVERLPSRLAQGGVLLDHGGGVEGGLHVQDRLLAALQHRVEAAQHGHGQDHVAVLPAHIEVAQDVVGEAPDVVRDPVEVAFAHVGADSIGWPTPCPDRASLSTLLARILVTKLRSLRTYQCVGTSPNHSTPESFISA